MNILICDDIKDESAKFETIIKKLGTEFDNIINFSNAPDVITYIRSGAKIDICFLDILMPEMNGVSLAAQLREEGFKGEIVFLTSSNEYAAESYKVEAFSYLLKPPDSESVKNILRKIDDLQKTADIAGIPVVTRNISRFLFFYEISHIEVIQHTVCFRLTDGSEVEVYATLKELIPKLSEDGRFARCHRSYVVNMNAISYIQDREIILKCGSIIPISKSYPEFGKQYLNWVFGGEM